MSSDKYLNIKINLEGEDLIFNRDEEKGTPYRINFEEKEPDYKKDNIDFINVEVNIAKVIHKVLSYIEKKPDLFEKQDFEFLGEILSKILFGKINYRSAQTRDFMLLVELLLDSGNKMCRIFLEFDHKSGVIATLPWEYTLHKIYSKKDPIYLSANVDSRVQLIRRLNRNKIENPESDKLFVIVLSSLGESAPDSDDPNVIRGLVRDFSELKNSFKELEENSDGKLIIKYIDKATKENIKVEIKNIHDRWRAEYDIKDSKLNYVLHYFGHAMLNNDIGKLVLEDKSTGFSYWEDDKNFVEIFNSKDLHDKQPSLVLFQACDSAKIGLKNNELRGVALEFTKINIPAVIGMQNEVDPSSSTAFFRHFYESILNAKDVAEAVTEGRDFLGTEYNSSKGVYSNNSFGSPVLFITTEEPLRLIKEFESADKGDSQKDESNNYESNRGSSRPGRLNDTNVRVIERQAAGNAGAVSSGNKGLQRSFEKQESAEDSASAEALKTTEPDKAATPNQSSNQSPNQTSNQTDK